MPAHSELVDLVSKFSVLCAVSSISSVCLLQEVSLISEDLIAINRNSSVLPNTETRKALDTFTKFCGNVKYDTLRVDCKTILFGFVNEWIEVAGDIYSMLIRLTLVRPVTVIAHEFSCTSLPYREL